MRQLSIADELILTATRFCLAPRRQENRENLAAAIVATNSPRYDLNPLLAPLCDAAREALRAEGAAAEKTARDTMADALAALRRVRPPESPHRLHAWQRRADLQ